MTVLLYVVTIASGLFLIGVVLLQAGKGADMGAAFGGASSTVFGPSGAANVMTRITAVTAVLWMGGSLALAVVSARDESVFDDVPEPAPLSVPAPLTPGDSPLENLLGAPAEATDAAAAARPAVETDEPQAAPAADVAGGVAGESDARADSETKAAETAPAQAAPAASPSAAQPQPTPDDDARTDE